MKTDRIPFLDLATPHRELRDELRAVFETALDTSQFVGGGMVQTFEQDFAASAIAALHRREQRDRRPAVRSHGRGRPVRDTVVTVPTPSSRTPRRSRRRVRGSTSSTSIRARTRWIQRDFAPTWKSTARATERVAVCE